MNLSKFEQAMLDQCKKTGDELFVGTKNHRLHLVPIGKMPAITLAKLQKEIANIEFAIFGGIVARRIAK